MGSTIHIDKCYCYNVSFKEIIELDIQDISSLQEITKCGTRCGYCIPYIKKSIQTKQEFFNEIIRE